MHVLRVVSQLGRGFVDAGVMNGSLVPWRGSSDVDDALLDQDRIVSLAGGYYESGASAVKNSYAVASATALMAWGLLEFPQVRCIAARQRPTADGSCAASICCRSRQADNLRIGELLCYAIACRGADMSGEQAFLLSVFADACNLNPSFSMRSGNMLLIQDCLISWVIQPMPNCYSMQPFSCSLCKVFI